MNAQLIAASPNSTVIRMRCTLAAPVPALPTPSHIDVPLGRMALFMGLSALDLVLTWILLRHTGGVVYESNPIANAFLSQYGWAGMAIFKLTDMLLVTFIVCLLGLFHPGAARRVLSIASTILSVVALYSLYLVVQFV